jgi:hypothetical protein
MSTFTITLPAEIAADLTPEDIKEIWSQGDHHGVYPLTVRQHDIICKPGVTFTAEQREAIQSITPPMTEEQGAELIRGTLGEQWMTAIQKRTTIHRDGIMATTLYVAYAEDNTHEAHCEHGDSVEDAVTNLLERAQGETP